MTWEPRRGAHSFPAMTNSLSHALAHAIVDDRLRTAHEGRTTRPVAGRLWGVMSGR
jgi:hypothetical protein